MEQEWQALGLGQVPAEAKAEGFPLVGPVVGLGLAVPVPAIVQVSHSTITTTATRCYYLYY